MAATLIVKANLECEKCYKKLQRVLRKLKEKEKIAKVDFDNTNNQVSVHGHFDEQKLSQKLRCMAWEAIKDIEIKQDKKPDEKKTEVKKEDKMPDDKKKPEEGMKQDDVNKSGEEKPKGEKAKAKGDAKVAAAPSTTTINLQLTQTCGICYPWPCSDPGHWGGGRPQWPCQGMAPALPAFPGHQPPMKWPCGGPSYCGGCGTCRGRGNGMHGLPAMPPPQTCCPGPLSCRGCTGCRIVQEGKFVYEDYPPNACAIV
ncbi:hypothetical protein GUJ93_ZPchr0013g37934 [Zizania palustris]|uniref:HMA domain-containing protein n=1 Tax=Zizania palustris TaxID=103762 RepID=A0A8J5WWN5_ZIZPA|nr:hypothetical protein GUJ93_ZPchr0013g37934 [Zizania palustris]